LAGTLATAAAIGGSGFAGWPIAARAGAGVAGALLLHPSPYADALGAIGLALALVLGRLTRRA
jgi:hypothetical protein